ncbi:MAG: type II toxin-antitoxin system RelE/ParE family toxin [Flavobacterium sp.]|nr:type II toxin-antitoxin system RelE/ParE family toxin [Flavobacterium sp.]MBP6587132.1 type II toxin-antitoxin system RelE/ParE family toxin [Flavobacterium sp.]MBP7471290.1 type II toxin-antitoxin system RelE/ParE family toxin [Flavobacterium sp.]
MRTIFKTPEFLEFMNNSETNVKDKIDYLLDIIATQPVINTKVAKKLINTAFYEVRIQVNNEYRIIVFAIDHDNITQSRNILFLNGFMKKSTKDYDKQIKTAIKILEQWKDQN